MSQHVQIGLPQQTLAVITTFTVLTIVPLQHGQSQTNVPAWQLSEPRLEIGGSGLELHRVRAGVVLRSGAIALADAGNARIILLGPDGKRIGVLGRSGSGPGDFQTIEHLAAFGDTLLAYDPITQQVSLWQTRPQGTLISAMSLMEADGTRLDFRGALSAGRYLVTSHTTPREDESPGLFHERVRLLLFEPLTRATVVLDTLEWRRLFLHKSALGVTNYATPFIGESGTAVVGGRIVVVPLGRSRIDVYPSDGGTDMSSVPLPVPVRLVDRAMVDAYRDSLVQRARRQAGMFPNAVAGIEGAFGPAFPVPQTGAVVNAIRVVGDRIWVQVFPSAADARATWYIVDPVRAGLIGRVTLPRSWDVLGGAADTVLILLRDGLGVESVRIHAIVRSGADE